VSKHVGAALIINILTKLSAQCWFFMYNPAMHGTNIKLKTDWFVTSVVRYTVIAVTARFE
jgi:hypothetical protein